MGTKNFSNANDLITFSRASGGTALRKIAYGSELVTNGTFDTDTAGWTARNAAISQTDYADRTDVLSIADGGAWSQAWQEITTEAGRLYKVTFDVARDASAEPALFQVYDGGGPPAASSGGLSSEIIDDLELSNTEFRNFSFFFVASSTTTTIAPMSNSNATSYFDNISVKEVLFDDASGDLTLFNHPADVPRIEYDADGNVLGLLVEESRTNLFPYSEDFDNAAWAKTGIDSVTKNQVGPDGALSGYTLSADSSSLSFVAEGFTVSTSTQYTFSVFAKAGTESWLALNIRDNTTVTDGVRYFDIASGALGVAAGSTLDGADIEDVGNGWYRCSITFTSDVADTSGVARIYVAEGNGDATTNDGTESIIIYGAQLEAGAFPTSYIPTAGATATRSADVASIPVADFGYNQSEGSVVVDINTPLSTGEVNYAFALDDGSVLNMAYIYRDASDTVVASTNNSGTTQGNLTLKTSALGNNKVAYVLSTNDSAAVCTGESVQTDATYSVPTVTNLVIGDRGAGSRELNGHIKSIKYYPRRLTNAQLQELTT